MWAALGLPTPSWLENVRMTNRVSKIVPVKNSSADISSLRASSLFGQQWEHAARGLLLPPPPQSSRFVSLAARAPNTCLAWDSKWRICLRRTLQALAPRQGESWNCQYFWEFGELLKKNTFLKISNLLYSKHQNLQKAKLAGIFYKCKHEANKLQWFPFSIWT